MSSEWSNTSYHHHHHSQAVDLHIELLMRYLDSDVLQASEAQHFKTELLISSPTYSYKQLCVFPISTCDHCLPRGLSQKLRRPPESFLCSPLTTFIAPILSLAQLCLQLYFYHLYCSLSQVIFLPEVFSNRLQYRTVPSAFRHVSKNVTIRSLQCLFIIMVPCISLQTPNKIKK